MAKINIFDTMAPNHLDSELWRLQFGNCQRGPEMGPPASLTKCLKEITRVRGVLEQVMHLETLPEDFDSSQLTIAIDNLRFSVNLEGDVSLLEEAA